MKKLFLTIIFSGLLFYTYGQFSLDVSGGLAGQTYNKAQIPNEEGTPFDLYKDFQIQTPVMYYNLKLGYSFRDKNHIFLLYAPLSVDYEGAAPFDIRFQNTTFLEEQIINARYKFNSYRATYRRDFYSSDKWIVGIGLTAEVRDAKIRLSESNTIEKKANFGFMPLWHLYAGYNLNNWILYFEGDGLANSSRRTFDLYLGGKRQINERLMLKVAYRLVEGGKDVKAVYNFAMLHFANLGVIINF
ncbi:hypothetical protein [Natronoflexus pectinivorans]|uniref:Outer membrane protein with beta-barrel domain n=1 Tax=Natronoflexus pectinivorans TaxID=682526 RepID=A0A4R2GPQ0_9BACT|nr:hypothetical protein [Natronoflexus pectinivorans]TCO11067.1 hypothetical protein EV194_101701 [Natronoflexus pectinivorans]